MRVRFTKPESTGTKKKKIYINGRFLSQATSGVQRFATEVTKGLDDMIGKVKDCPFEAVIIAPKDANHNIALNHIQVIRKGWTTGHAWEQFELPRYTGGNLLLNFGNTGPILYRNQLVVIHDLATFAAPKGFSVPFLTWYRVMLPLLHMVSRRVLTMSEFSKGEMSRFFWASEKVHVIYNGIDHLDSVISDTAALAKFGLKDKKYVLSGVGTAHPNKNYGTFMKVAEILKDEDVEFVIAGYPGGKAFAKETSASDSARFLGRTTDEELKALYENAACFVFPSKYEGFGIPPLEAMACGCPVVASSAPSIPEICGDAALYANSERASEFANQVLKCLHTPGVRDKLADRGRLHSKYFSWRNSARCMYLHINQTLILNGSKS